MKQSTKLRFVGAAIILFNLWLIGQYNLTGIPVLLLTVGVAVAFEMLLVRPALKDEKAQKPP